MQQQVLFNHGWMDAHSASVTPLPLSSIHYPYSPSLATQNVPTSETYKVSPRKSPVKSTSSPPIASPKQIAGQKQKAIGLQIERRVDSSDKERAPPPAPPIEVALAPTTR